MWGSQLLGAGDKAWGCFLAFDPASQATPPDPEGPAPEVEEAEPLLVVAAAVVISTEPVTPDEPELAEGLTPSAEELELQEIRNTSFSTYQYFRE